MLLLYIGAGRGISLLQYTHIHRFVNSQHVMIVMYCYVMYVLGLTTLKSVSDTTADYIELQNSLRMLQNIHS